MKTLIIGSEQHKSSVICTGVVVLASPAARTNNYHLLVCAWEDQRENQYYICHKISSIYTVWKIQYSGQQIQYSYFNFSLQPM